jgi:uncharacterized protein (DUF2062 family)
MPPNKTKTGQETAAANIPLTKEDRQLIEKRYQSQQKLIDQLKKANQQLARFNSLPRSLAKGILSGLGVAIGASIVAAILWAIFMRVYQAAESIPGVDIIIEKSQIEDFIEKPQE